MFDVGFSEMIVIAIVALVVLGPEKLPKIARTVGKFYGSMQRTMSGFKADIEREVALDNMRKATAEAQQKLLELQSQVQVLSGEIPELAARAQDGVEHLMHADSLAHELSQPAPALNSEAIGNQQAASAMQADPIAQQADPVASNPVLAETSVKEDEVLWKKKA